MSLKNGLIWDFDHNCQMIDGRPTPRQEAVRDVGSNQNTRISIRPGLLTKLKEAMHGGTEEKHAYLAEVSKQKN